MKQIFCFAVYFAVVATVASAQSEPEHFEIEINLRYELSQNTASQLGVNQRGEINAAMTFVRPDCLVRVETSGSSYPAIHSHLKAFDKEAVNGLSASSQLSVRNDFNGNDWVQLNLNARGIRLGPQRIGALVLNAGQLPLDAVSSNDFIADEGLLTDILQYPGLYAYGQFVGSSTADFSLQVTDIQASVSHNRARPTTSSQYPTCTPPKP